MRDAQQEFELILGNFKQAGKQILGTLATRRPIVGAPSTLLISVPREMWQVN